MVPTKMSFDQKTGIVWDMFSAIQVSFIPTLWAIVGTPSLLWNWRKLQQVVMGNIWANGFGEGVNSGSATIKERLITPNARGVVMDIGAGHGHTLRFLDKRNVVKYIAVEPNAQMHPFILLEGEKAGIPTEILAMGINDIPPQLRVDIIVCWLTLCSVDNVQIAAQTLHSALRPGGVLVVYEHVKSKIKEAESWQRFWEPIWALLFDCCKLTVDSLEIISSLDWKEKTASIMEGDDPMDLFVHEHGIFIK
ncbi:S-adenosyl-L-methionine-dependent methyltransferase [Obelidium mucronatum]|nr:S-adenosyl-L-methionine-dependent methyltransferase [Obelidium mucronatum]